MLIDFDPAKNERNVRRPRPVVRARHRFRLRHGYVLIDDRRDYGEMRYIAVGNLDGRLHVLCYTLIRGGIRVISFRKANRREAYSYGKSQTPD